MKKLFISCAIILSVLVLGNRIYQDVQLKDRYKNFSITSYNLGRKDYKLLVADTPEKWEKGLMFFEKLDGVDGMIFIFPDKQVRTFWNKNTLMDLDLYWMDGEILIGKSFLPSIEKSKEIIAVNSVKPVNKVIELIKK